MRGVVQNLDRPPKPLSPFYFSLRASVVGVNLRAMRASRRYGTVRRTLRKRVSQDVGAGTAVCWRCHLPIHPREQWHLGHADDGRHYMGPEHARCNLSAAGKVRAEQLYGSSVRARRWSRHWGGSDTFEEWCSECRRAGRACGTGQDVVGIG
jgi:hypothetical protein